MVRVSIQHGSLKIVELFALRVGIPANEVETIWLYVTVS